MNEESQNGAEQYLYFARRFFDSVAAPMQRNQTNRIKSIDVDYPRPSLPLREH